MILPFLSGKEERGRLVFYCSRSAGNRRKGISQIQILILQGGNDFVKLLLRFKDPRIQTSATSMFAA